MILINGKRNGYAPDQCGETLTVGELIEALEEFNENDKVYLCNDNGYTYGSITGYDINDSKDAEDDDDIED